jgi:hypothetical protein
MYIVLDKFHLRTGSYIALLIQKCFNVLAGVEERLLQLRATTMTVGHHPGI